MGPWIRLSCGLCAAAAFLPASGAPGKYQFTKIADNDDGFDTFGFGRATINLNGEVAFRAQRLNGDGAVFRGSGGALTLIADDGDGFTFIGFNPDINDAGEVCFAANASGGGEFIMRGSGGPLAVIAGTDPDRNGSFEFFGFDTSINDDGFVVFAAELDNTELGVFTGNGGPANTVFTSADGMFNGSFDRPAINDAGQVAFFTFLPGGDVSAIYRADGDNPFVRIADTNGIFADLSAPDISSGGEVAFFARFDDLKTEAIYVGDGDTLTLIADNLGPFDRLDPPSLNDRGRVAFRAYYETKGGGDPFFEGGLLVGSHVVIETGDALDGSVVENIIFRQSALNNRGEVAFVVQLMDGRTAVVRATPRCSADFDGSGDVDFLDLLALLAAWGPCA